MTIFETILLILLAGLFLNAILSRIEMYRLNKAVEDVKSLTNDNFEFLRQLKTLLNLIEERERGKK